MIEHQPHQSSYLLLDRKERIPNRSSYSENVRIVKTRLAPLGERAVVYYMVKMESVRIHLALVFVFGYNTHMTHLNNKNNNNNHPIATATTISGLAIVIILVSTSIVTPAAASTTTTTTTAGN